jgi:hypothetical protein
MVKTQWIPWECLCKERMKTITSLELLGRLAALFLNISSRVEKVY